MTTMPPLSHVTAQQSLQALQHPRARDVLLARMHKGHKWFDSGEYFLSKEGRQPLDVLPGGAPADALPPKLEPTPSALAHRQSSMMSRSSSDTPAQVQPASITDY